MTVKIELTNEQARVLVNALAGTGAQGDLRRQLMLQLPSAPVRCDQCRAPQGSERAYVGHLIEAHHYVDAEVDPEGGREDDAQSTAWSAFHGDR